MTVTAAQLLPWCRNLLQGQPRLPLESYLDAIPRLDALADLPSGTAVLVRGDLDCKPGPRVGEGDIRLRSMLDTLNFGRERGWRQVLFGHVGRKPEGSLRAVAARLGELLGIQVPLIENWLDPQLLVITAEAARALAATQPGSVVMLENTRRYEIERVLWDATPQDLEALCPRLATLANQFAQHVAVHYVHEAFSAGSLDASSVIVPAAMQRVALGRYAAAEFDGPLRRCLRAVLVVFSGLKADKLDDLEAVIQRGSARWIFVAGSLAMALKKAEAQLAGGDFCVGVAEDPARASEPYYLPPARIEQARRLLQEGRAQGIRFVLPVDFVLQDGRVAERIGPQDQQLDVGPRSSELFEQEVEAFLRSVVPHSQDQPPVAFYNGVFGKFEDPRFEAGTRRFITQLRRMKEAGVEVYVGGGEGGAALERYGQPDWVTHGFTAGGTVLNALGANPVPFLQALYFVGRPPRQ
jgi:phosphoglycerate kinase